VSNNKGDGGGKDCGGNEGGKRQGGWGWQGDGDGDKVGGRATATATKRAVAMVTRVVGKDAMANGSTMVMLFLGLAFDVPPFFSRPCFILAQKVCAKLCFCILCLCMGSSTFHKVVGGKGMFLSFYVFWKQVCGHPLRGGGGLRGGSVTPVCHIPVNIVDEVVRFAGILTKKV
jgi:hypothetical protein